MKKFTLLFLLIAAPFVSNAQTWDFNNSDDGWDNTVRLTAGTNDTFLGCTFTKDNSNASIEKDDCGINTDNVHIIAITVKNSNHNTKSLKIGSTNDSGGKVWISIDISGDDSDYKTYYFDMSGDTDWSGTVDVLKIIFLPVVTDDLVLIDKIELLSDIPVTEKSTYNFDTDYDNEYWDGENLTIESVLSGVMTVNPIGGKFAKLRQFNHSVDANDFNSVRIKLKNNSSGDNIANFIWSESRLVFPISVSDTEYKTYEFRLDTVGGGGKWLGNINNISFKFSDESGKSSGTGSIEIDLIEFYSVTATRILKNKVSDLNLAPNPSHGIFRLNSEKTITGYTLFNATGQVVKRVNSLNSNSPIVDVSGSTKGLYLIKVEYENGESEIVRTVVK